MPWSSQCNDMKQNLLALCRSKHSCDHAPYNTRSAKVACMFYIDSVLPSLSTTVMRRRRCVSTPSHVQHSGNNCKRIVSQAARLRLKVQWTLKHNGMLMHLEIRCTSRSTVVRDTVISESNRFAYVNRSI